MSFKSEIIIFLGQVLVQAESITKKFSFKLGNKTKLRFHMPTHNFDRLTFPLYDSQRYSSEFNTIADIILNISGYVTHNHFQVEHHTQ